MNDKLTVAKAKIISNVAKEKERERILGLIDKFYLEAVSDFTPEMRRKLKDVIRSKKE